LEPYVTPEADKLIVTTAVGPVPLELAFRLEDEMSGPGSASSTPNTKDTSKAILTAVRELRDAARKVVQG